MGENTKIEWATHTFNAWWGCTKVSQGCVHCYAETMDKRTGGDHWGPGKPRKTMSDSYWHQPLKWDAAAKASDRRDRVFCSSMADVFDIEAPAGQRERIWGLIRQTPNLDWLLLTKRPGNIRDMLPADWGNGYPNVWLGATVEDQSAADTRIPILLSIPAVVRFLSCEPLIGPVTFRWAAWAPLSREPGAVNNHLDGLKGIDWVICGGESGHGSRPMHPDWARSLRDQCVEAGVPFLFKQWGDWKHMSNGYDTINCRLVSIAGNVGPIPYLGWGHDRDGPQWEVMKPTGKKAAGRLLDGRTWDEFPAPSVTAASDLTLF